MVDLGDPQIADHHLRPRFVARVLADEEQARLRETLDPRRLLWSLFAAKEAAYKLIAGRAAAPVVFAHRRFVVAQGLDRVDYGTEAIALRVVADRDAVHALAGRVTVSGIERVASGVDPGVAARALLCAALAGPLACAAADLQIVRAARPSGWDGFGPPRLLRHGVPIAVDISLSHDGRFAAFAAALETNVA